MRAGALQGLRFMTYPEFWRRYLAAHSDSRTRGLHYLGTSLAVAAIAAAAAARDWRWLVASPVAGYSLAWLGHLKFEHNRPETFGHPVWSLISDFRMLGMFLGGRLDGELRALGVGGGSDDGAADRVR
jgi:hypothetical protein